MTIFEQMVIISQDDFISVGSNLTQVVFSQEKKVGYRCTQRPREGTDGRCPSCFGKRTRVRNGVWGQIELVENDAPTATSSYKLGVPEQRSFIPHSLDASITALVEPHPFPSSFRRCGLLHCTVAFSCSLCDICHWIWYSLGLFNMVSS